MVQSYLRKITAREALLEKTGPVKIYIVINCFIFFQQHIFSQK